MDPWIKSIAIGCLLGDGYVYPNGTLQIDHSWSQRAYVEWTEVQPIITSGRETTKKGGAD